MRRSSYGERDYAFGQLILTLRSAIGLTQAGLSDQLGISKKAVGEWEAGSSYPKATHLKALLALAVKEQVFPIGHEEEEIRALWKAARQKMQLDEAWLHALLTSSEPIQHDPATKMQVPHAKEDAGASPRIDWIGALDTSHFTGREAEIAQLTEWIVQEHCRVVTLLGMGGIGKSLLASFLGQQLAPQFEAVLWYSVRDAPVCEDVVSDCITFFSQTPPTDLPASLERRINQLLALLQTRRCLLVLDNLETLLGSGNQEGDYLPGYEGYGRLLQRFAESAHQSCVLLTSREKPKEIEPLEGRHGPVRSLRLTGVDEQTARTLLDDKDLSGTPVAWQQLVASYGGNPLALKIVAQVLVDLFESNIDRFLQEGSVIFNGIRPMLRQQVERLTSLEHLLLTWLAVLREWTPLETLQHILFPGVPRRRMLEALEALARRSLLEQGQQTSFSLQSVVMEYLTTVLVERLSEEIVQEKPQQIRRYALEQGQAKDFIRQTQVRLLVHPLLEQLRFQLETDEQIETHLLRLLSQFRTEDAAAQGYGPANVISLLKALWGHLRGLDLSRLVIRGASLHGIEMQDARLREAVFQESAFTELLDAIYAVAISPTGQYWAAASLRGEVRVWREAGRVLHRIWQAHTNVVSTLTFSPDGLLLVSSGWDDTIKLWEVVSGKLLWTGVQNGNVWVAFSPDGRLLASGGADATIRLWDSQSGTVVRLMPSRGGTVCWLAWSPDGTHLASGCADGNIWVWQPHLLESEDQGRQLSGHTYWVPGLAFAPNGEQLASASFDGTVKLWNMERMECIQTFSGHTDRVIRVVWSPDGRTLASAGFDKTIWLWDTEKRRPRGVLRGHTSVIHTLAFTPDSRTLLSGCEDGTMRVWDVEGGRCLRSMEGYVALLHDVDWSPDGKQLVTGGADTLVTIWDRASGTPSCILREHHWVVLGVAWSPDGRLLASAGQDGSIALWDASRGVRLDLLRLPDGEDTILQGVAWSPDGHLLACGSYLHGVLMWNMTLHTRQWMVQTPSLIRRVAWSPDGTRVVGGGDDGLMRVWVAADGSERLRVRHARAIFCVAWSPDGKWLAFGGGGSQGAEIVICEAQSGERVRTLVSHPGVVYALAWSVSGEMLMSGGSDGKTRWWEVSSGQCVRVREAHQGMVQALKVSPNGTMFASCGDDGAVLIWDLHSGELLRTLRRDRPYERLNITGIKGLTEAQKASLHALGAFEDASIL